MDKKFILTKLALLELGEMGYMEVWLGNVPNPHFEHGMNNGIVASPKVRPRGFPALWDVSERNFGREGCGNGLKGADQTQRELVREMIPGHYLLKNGEWFPEETVGEW